VLETSDGRIAAVEVKAAQSVNTMDIRCCSNLRELLGTRFVGGVLLYAGQETHSLRGSNLQCSSFFVMANRGSVN